MSIWIFKLEDNKLKPSLKNVANSNNDEATIVDSKLKCPICGSISDSKYLKEKVLIMN